MSAFPSPFNPAPTLALALPTMQPFQFPLRGLNENWSRVGQPEGTTPDCMNVMPYDVTSRARGGQRPGFALTSSTQYGSTTNVCRAQLLMPLTTEVGGVRKDYLICVAGGRVYFGTAAGTLNQITTTASGFSRGVAWQYWSTAGSPYGSTTTSALAVDGYPVMCGAAMNGIAYLVDGKSTNGVAIDFTVSPPVWAPPLVSHGITPWTNQASIAVVYRKRLVLSGMIQADPQNLYASKVGDPNDWDYTKTGSDAAWAANAAKAGQIGDPVTALVPFGDDAMLIGCDKSIWLMNGDISAGGRIDVVSRNCGMLGQQAWTFDPNGNLYFLGTTGLFRMQRGVYQLENLSDSVFNSYFVNLTGGAKKVLTLLWDRDRHGLWIFATPDTQGAATHCWWDERTGGFFPQQIPNVMGPTAAMMWAPQGGGQTLVMGGYAASSSNGAQLYKLDATVSTDAGAVVNSYAWCGPVRPGSVSQESLLEACEFVCGELAASFTGTFNVNYTLQSGASAYAAYAAPSGTTGGTFTLGGRQTLQRNRLRGESFMLKLSNSGSNTTWGLEEAVGHFRPMGRVRQ